MSLLQESPAAIVTSRFVEQSLVLDLTSLESTQHLVSPELVDQVLMLMTPEHIRNQQEHEREIISPTQYPTFDALMSERGRIRDLRLVPIRGAVSQQAYLGMPRELFIDIVRNGYLRSSPLALVRELYPSELPSEVQQYVVWAGDHHIDDRAIAKFIAQALGKFGLSERDAILFERSRESKTDFVRAAIPEFRHIHLWLRSARIAS